MDLIQQFLFNILSGDTLTITTTVIVAFGAILACCWRRDSRTY